MNPNRRPDRRFWQVLAALAGLLLLWAVVTCLLLLSTLDAAERDTVLSLLGGRMPLALMTLLFVLMLAAAGLNQLYRRYIVAPARLVDEARIVLGTDAERTLTPQGDAENRALADVIAGFVEQRARLRADIAEQVRAASRNVEQERSRLAALMSELTQSVVVCNLDGRILL